MAEVTKNKPIAPSGFYAIDTENGTEYIKFNETTKYGNPGADGAIAQGYRYVGTEDPRAKAKTEEVKEVEVKPATPKAKK